ncbi:GGDEF domain-containing protein [Candidatus Stoquefichus massiliensis]|uniref:GGDEF domain-containing protein n=1 Tax=Candidatus Stoquefichus massiliensis TaxID=1470350 RepID=UPI000486F545|nr:GGDEF domain-containing protein [Candidatus Stoquefichus massiliensis]
MYPMNNIDQDLKQFVNEIHLFDQYRLVNHETFEVYDYQNKQLIKSNHYCYEVWKRGGPCKNCTSRQAYINKSEMFKLEFLAGYLFLIISYPILISQQNFVLELIKDVTQSLTVRNIDRENNEVEKLIRDLNDYIIHDAFTGLYNKAHAIQEIDRKLNMGKRLTLAMIDLDHFKEINDTYGHVKGDEAILFLAELLKQHLDNEHVLASRVGGDEFIIIFDDVSDYDVHIICYEIHEALHKHVFMKDEEQFFIEISIGLAYSHDNDTSVELMDRADQAMYQVKHTKAKKPQIDQSPVK